MIEFHATVNISLLAEDLVDAFKQLAKVVQSRRNLISTDDEAQLEACGVKFYGTIDVHRADQCPYEQEEEKEPWQQ